MKTPALVVLLLLACGRGADVSESRQNVAALDAGEVAPCVVAAVRDCARVPCGPRDTDAYEAFRKGEAPRLCEP